jgi:hypothetical protein
MGGLLALCLAQPFVTRAQTDDAVIRAITRHLEARGAHDIREVARAFLFEGSARVVDAVAETRTCMGFLALGLGDVRDIDLALYTRAGQAISEDSGTAPYAYVRACVDAGMPLYVSAQMYEGRGELLILRMRDAPRELGRFAESIPWAVSPGGRLEATRAIGTVGESSVLEGPAVEEERALAELGYVAVGTVTPLLLRGGLGMAQFSLDQGGCYRVVVLVPFARGVAVTVSAGPDQSWDGHARTGDRATAFVCTARGGTFAVRVESRVLRSVAIVRAFAHPQVSAREVATLGEARALGVAEARHVGATRGLVVEHVGQGWVEGAVPLTWPLSLEAGRCYAVWALGPRGLPSVDVRLTDGHGVLLARTEGPPHGASVFHCAAANGVVRLELRPKGEDGMVSLWVGSSQEKAP